MPSDYEWEVFVLILCFVYSSFLLATSLFLVILGFPGKAEPVFFLAALGVAALRGTAGIWDSASLLTMDLGGAAPVLRRPTHMYCFLLPASWRGLELWGRLHLWGYTMSSVLWELACSIWPDQMPRKSALLLPFRTPAGPAHLVYSASTCLLSVPCVWNRGGCTQGPTCPVSFWINEQEHLPKCLAYEAPSFPRGASQEAMQALKPRKHVLSTVSCSWQDKSSDAPCVLRAASTRFHPGNFLQISAGGVFPAERYSNRVSSSSWP